MLAHVVARGMMITPSEPVSHRPRAARERLTATLSGRLATAWSRLAIAAASARGRHHRVNEDSHSPLDGIAPLFIVADGVGGGAMASWASRQLVARVHRKLERHRLDADAIRAALLDADRAIAKGIAHRSGTTGAATVALCAGTGVLRSRWLIGWVGDCRVYRIARDSATPAQLLTCDDTYQHLSEDPPPGGSPDDPARMIGNGAVSAPNVERVDLGWDEMLLLASDGVHKHVEPLEMAHVLREEAPLARRCLRLVEIARTHGSHDDATVLVVHRETQPRVKLIRYAAGALVALTAAWLVVLWPDILKWWQS
jgi:serine/threonine protein phosphatase PrpC